MPLLYLDQIYWQFLKKVLDFDYKKQKYNLNLSI